MPKCDHCREPLLGEFYLQTPAGHSAEINDNFPNILTVYANNLITQLKEAKLSSECTREELIKKLMSSFALEQIYTNFNPTGEEYRTIFEALSDEQLVHLVYAVENNLLVVTWLTFDPNCFENVVKENNLVRDEFHLCKVINNQNIKVIK